MTHFFFFSRQCLLLFNVFSIHSIVLPLSPLLSRTYSSQMKAYCQ